MARCAQPVRRPRSPGAAAVWAVLLAVLVTLLGPDLGSEHPRALLAAQVVSAHGEPQADSAEPGVSTAAVRGPRDSSGERHAPPVAAPGASSATGTGPLQPAQPPVAAEGPPAARQPAHGHGVRAPPALSGI
ncbi:hypothetical protein GCM10010431_64950 [Streptomyces kunmingensis]